MPARRESSPAAAKRKSSVSGHSPVPSSKAKKRLTQDNNRPAIATGAASRANKFIVGVAGQLLSSRGDAAVDGDVDVDVEGAGRAAVEALPEGKLKAELLRDEAATIKAVKAKDGKRRKHSGGETAEEDNGAAGPATAAEAADGGGGGGVVIPCTNQLYRRARATAEDQRRNRNDDKLLKALALSPRAPLDLLVDAIGTATAMTDGSRANSSGAGSATSVVEPAVTLLRNLAMAVAADPRAVVSSPSGLNFFADRAAVLASSAAKALTVGCDSGNGGSEGASAAAAGGEALGLMLRLLQVAAQALSALGNKTAAAVGNSGWGGGGGGGGNDDKNDAQEESVVAADPADQLILPYSPEISSLPSSDALVVTAAAEPATSTGNTGGSYTTTAKMMPPPPARLSVARLLAHYAVVSATCCSARSGRREKGVGAAAAAAAVIKSARAATVVGVARDTEDGGESSSSSSSSDGEDAGTLDSNNSVVLSRHLSALCAGLLAGNEPATLEFVRCVGDFFFVPSSSCSSSQGSAATTTAVASAGGNTTAITAAAAAAHAAVRGAFLAPACARALARLPRPSISHSPPTAAQFLKRAYCYRVVDALNQSATAAEAASVPSRPRERGAVTAAVAIARGVGWRPKPTRSAHGGSSASSSSPWDFVGAVGASGAPSALLEFLGRPEAPAAVGKGLAGTALKELATRRDSLAAVAE
ncbi:unnamed protein product, partial [Pylaiella littoralis]